MKALHACLALTLVATTAEFTRAAESNEVRQSWVNDPVCQTVFFAVLEGLYTDGVSNETVDLIVPPDPTSKKPTMEDHFIYACPLCHPAFEAFRLYRSRLPIYGLKPGNIDTFGSGIGGALLQRFHSPEKTVRLQAIQELIQTWVKRRLDSMRLSPQEFEQWTKRIEQRRDEGAKMLENFRAGNHGSSLVTRYADWKACAICDGSAGACKLPRPAQP